MREVVVRMRTHKCTKKTHCVPRVLIKDNTGNDTINIKIIELGEKKKQRELKIKVGERK